jgi:hypothetical protein
MSHFIDAALKLTELTEQHTTDMIIKLQKYFDYKKLADILVKYHNKHFHQNEGIIMDLMMCGDLMDKTRNFLLVDIIKASIS